MFLILVDLTIITEGSSFHCVPLSKLFTQSFSTGLGPRSGHARFVTMGLSCNYRPISLTFIAVKVIERTIHYQIGSALCFKCLECYIHCLFLDYAKSIDSSLLRVPQRADNTS